MSAPLVFLDTETTGLDPDRHEIWELALIYDNDSIYELQLPVDLTRADPTGLRIGGFYKRRRPLSGLGDPARLCQSRFNGDGKFTGGLGVGWYASQVATILDGCHIVGAVPSFDAAFLTRWLNRNGQAATWHYHLVDVEALVAGKLGIPPPWDSDALTEAAGVACPPEEERHTALGDALWAKRLYDSVMP